MNDPSPSVDALVEAVTVSIGEYVAEVATALQTLPIEAWEDAHDEAAARVRVKIAALGDRVRDERAADLAGR